MLCLRGAALFFICQCRYVLGSSLKVNIKQDSLAPHHVSNSAAADWLERALWGPGGSSSWRRHGFLDEKRLRLKRIAKLHLLPDDSDHQNTTLSLTHVLPELEVPEVPEGPTRAPSPPSKVSIPDDETDFNDDADDEDADDDDATETSQGDDREDVLSAGLTNFALRRERRSEEYREEQKHRRHERARKERRKALARRHARIARIMAVRRTKRRRMERQRHAAALKSGNAAIGQINQMLKQVTEESELEKSRCETYTFTAKKEAEDARTISWDDQERLAVMETNLHSSRAESDDIDSQVVELREQRKKHQARCAADLAKLRAEVVTLESDANTTTRLMKASPCHGRALLLECRHRGSRNPYISSRHRGLYQVMAQLSTSTARRSLQRSLRHSVARKRREDLVLLQRRTHHRRLRHRAHRRHRNDNAEERCKAARLECDTIDNSIILLLADVQDKQNMAKANLAETTSACTVETSHLEEQIQHLESRKETLSQQVAQTLADRSGLQGEASVRLQETARIQENLGEVTKECQHSMNSYERQTCRLRSSRADVFESAGMTVTADAKRDCEVSPWTPAEPCSEQCGGGVQRLNRTIVVPAGSQGMACPVLATTRPCNVHSCPLNCKVSEWTGWSQCSAICGGGMRYRTRHLLQMAQHGGRACPGENGNSEACNAQPCVQSCIVGAWTPWSTCSRACNGGYKARRRVVTEPPGGNPSCAEEDTHSEYMKCTNAKCPQPQAGQTLKCNSSVDVVVVLDGSGDVSKVDYGHAKKFVETLFKGLSLGEGKGQAGLVVAGGPKKWANFEKCKLAGSSSGALASCNVVSKLALTATEGTATGAASGAGDPPGGPAYTAGALSIASTLLDQGRSGAESIVLVVGHGRPLSESRTSSEADKIRGKARLMWLVVAGAPSDEMADRRLSAELASHWASRPYSDNVFQIHNYTDLPAAETVSEVVSAVCPSVSR